MGLPRRRACRPTDGDPEDDLTYRRCGVRETFEEARIKLGDPEALVPFCRWITPELAPMRFDTRFYLAAAPQGAEPAPDRREVDRAEWWTPAKAIHLFVQNEAELHFPTIKQVEQLAEFATTDEALDAHRGVPVEPILPRVASSDEGFRDPAARRSGLRRRRVRRLIRRHTTSARGIQFFANSAILCAHRCLSSTRSGRR